MTVPGALEKRLETLVEQFDPHLVNIDATLNRKLDAVAVYSSQLNGLFGGNKAMADSVRTYAYGLNGNASLDRSECAAHKLSLLSTCHSTRFSTPKALEQLA